MYDGTLIFMIICGSRQCLALPCFFSNAIVSLETRSFSQSKNIFNHPLIDNYTHGVYHRDKRNVLSDLILRIISNYNDTTRYKTTRFLVHPILQVQNFLAMTINFSLVTKLGHKYKTYNIYIFNHESNDTNPTFTKIAWRYDHDNHCTC